MSYGLKFTFLALILSFQTVAMAENWPHWRGESGNGISTTATPPASWSETDHIQWKVAVPGRGSSSPIIWKDRVYVTSAEQIDSTASGLPTFRFMILCYNRDNGELVWQKIAIEAQPHEETHQTNGFASASPCTDGTHLYVSFGSRGLYCYTLDGELVWKKMLGQMQTRNMFGEGSSPTLAGNKLIVPWDHEGQSYLFALDKKTGETIWKVERDEPTCWATPLIVEHDSQKQIIMNGENYARSYDLETGKELWRCGGQTQRPVASPVHQDGLVIVGSGFRGAFVGAFELDGTGDIAGTDNVVWSRNRDTPDIASLLLTEGRLYYYKAKTGLLTCVDANTGEPYYSTERIGLTNIYASPVATPDYIYLSDRDGTTVVIENSPELKIVSTNTLGETIDATPSPVDDQLFIRGDKHLFCISH